MLKLAGEAIMVGFLGISAELWRRWAKITPPYNHCSLHEQGIHRGRFKVIPCNWLTFKALGVIWMLK